MVVFSVHCTPIEHVGVVEGGGWREHEECGRVRRQVFHKVPQFRCLGANFATLTKAHKSNTKINLSRHNVGKVTIALRNERGKVDGGL